MLFKVLKYDVLRNGTAVCQKLASAPKSTPPVPLTDLRKLLLDLAHQIADRAFEWHGHKHMGVIS